MAKKKNNTEPGNVVSMTMDTPEEPTPEQVKAWLEGAVASPGFIRYGLRVFERSGATMVCRLTSTDPIGAVRHPNPTRSKPIIHIYNHLFRTLIDECGNQELADYIRANLK